ncbi:MAG: discoidin domain-containing protein [Capsulimonas sp.]|uniref:discoidin domain-containing protein n=1 Tax=Capsulimonas sp. TaxID=2494211 RepID=UPI0032654240
MSTAIFETGTLYAKVKGRTLSQALLTASRRQVGAGAAIVNPVANAVDGNPATLVDFASSDGTNYQYIVIDLGVSRIVSKVVVTGVSSVAALSAVVKNTLSNGAPPVDGVGGAVGLTATPAPAYPVVAGSVTFLSGAAAPEGRYLYIFPAAAQAWSLGDIAVQTTARFIPVAGLEFAVLQTTSVEHKTQEKKLFGPSSVSRFPVAVGFYGGEATLKVESAVISADTLQLITGGALTSNTVGGATTLTVSVGRVVSLPRFAAVFTAQDTDGNDIIYTYGNVVAPGVQIPFKNEDFAMQSVTLEAYPDEDGIVYTVSYPTPA